MGGGGSGRCSAIDYGLYNPIIVRNMFPEPLYSLNKVASRKLAR
jgi:hypothetical protein